MESEPRILVTAFTSFGRFSVNPSALLAERLGVPFQLLEVSYVAADLFVASLDENDFDLAIHLGVAGNSSDFRLETVARNRLDAIPDVRGHIPMKLLIDDTAPAALNGTLWPAELLAHPPASVIPSDDAGGYLCNYLYFRILQRFPHKEIGFLHVPPLEKIGLDEQERIAREVFARSTRR
jgi:pyroglutamyl-peptidase